MHPMFIATLSTIAKVWKKNKSPSMDERIKKMWHIYICVHMDTHIHTYMHTYIHTHIHTMEYYSAIKKNEILSFATTWMELEGIMLSEISQSEKISYDFTHMRTLRDKIDEHKGTETETKII